MTQNPSPSPQQQSAIWDVVAPTYAEDAWQWSDYSREALRTVPLETTHRILDVATGPGTLALAAAPLVARVDAVDFSPGMIEELRSRAKRDGLDNVSAAVMDAHELTFSDATFDAVFCQFGFFFFADRARVFREMYRVLRPGGRLLIATWSPIERRPVMKLGFDALAEAMPDLPRPAKGDLQDPAECVREMSAAGFHDVAAHLFTSSTRVESAESYLDLLERSGAPIAAMKKKVGETSWRAMAGPILDAIRRRLPEGGADLSAESIYTVGTK